LADRGTQGLRQFIHPDCGIRNRHLDGLILERQQDCQGKVEKFANTAIIGIAIVLLGFLLFFEKGKNRKGIVPTKTMLSALFVVAAVI